MTTISARAVKDAYHVFMALGFICLYMGFYNVGHPTAWIGTRPWLIWYSVWGGLCIVQAICGWICFMNSLAKTEKGVFEERFELIRVMLLSLLMLAGTATSNQQVNFIDAMLAVGIFIGSGNFQAYIVRRRFGKQDASIPAPK